MMMLNIGKGPRAISTRIPETIVLHLWVGTGDFMPKEIHFP